MLKCESSEDVYTVFGGSGTDMFGNMILFIINGNCIGRAFKTTLRTELPTSPFLPTNAQRCIRSWKSRFWCTKIDIKTHKCDLQTHKSPPKAAHFV